MNRTWKRAFKDTKQDLEPILQRLKENEDFQAYLVSLADIRERFIQLAYNSDYDQSQNKALGAVAVVDELLQQATT